MIRLLFDGCRFGSLNENMKKARLFDAVGEERYLEDMKRIEEIKSEILGEQ